MKHDYSIECEHIVLVPMDEQTSELYRKLRNREDNREFFFNSAVIEKEQQIKWFHSYLEKKEEFMFAILFRETMKFIGGIGIYDINFEQQTAEVGRIIVDRNVAAGKGYGTEAIKGIVEIARDKLGMEEVCAYIYRTNIASVKAFFKAGFSESIVENKEDKIIRAQKKLL